MTAKLTIDEGKSLLRQYCNFQERCHQDVRTKGLTLGFRGSDLEEIISAMISEGLLNEERYAKALARGKFRINEWGKIKIKQALKQHAIPDYCIQKALNEIDDSDYRDTIIKLANKKRKELSLKGKIDENKVVNYLLQKGFEWEKVAEVVKGE